MKLHIEIAALELMLAQDHHAKVPNYVSMLAIDQQVRYRSLQEKTWTFILWQKCYPSLPVRFRFTTI